MSEGLEADGQAQGLTYTTKRRVLGPYEEWTARPVDGSDLPAVVLARRPHSERPDPEVLGRHLEQASARALHVEHHLIVQCFGMLSDDPAEAVQLLEAPSGLDLEQLHTIAVSRLPDVPALLWVVRQLVDALSHAHTLGVVHGALSPAHVMVEASGEVKVDFGLSAGRTPDPMLTDYIDLRYGSGPPSDPDTAHQVDIYAAAAILQKLLTGDAGPLDKAGPEGGPDPRLPPKLIASVVAVLDRRPEALDLPSFQATLDHSFYVDFAADDLTDGRDAVQQWLERAKSELDNPDAPLGNAGPPPAGQFTRALQVRDAPVEPQELSTEDAASFRSPGWVKPDVLESRPASEHPTDPPEGPTEASFESDPADDAQPASNAMSASPTPLAVAVVSPEASLSAELEVLQPDPQAAVSPAEPSAPRPASVRPSLSRPESVHGTAAISAPSVTAPPRPPLRLSWWTFVGFVLTFASIMLWKVLSELPGWSG